MVCIVLPALVRIAIGQGVQEEPVQEQATRQK